MAGRNHDLVRTNWKEGWGPPRYGTAIPAPSDKPVNVKSMLWAPDKLPPSIQKLVAAMAYGVSETLFPASPKPIPPGRPLSVRQAAFALGMQQRRCDEWSMTPKFRHELKAAVKARREAEEPENLAVAIGLRDDSGDGSPEAGRLRLAAIDRIRIKEPQTAVNVSLSSQQATFLGGEEFKPMAGYVIKIGNETDAEGKE